MSGRRMFTRNASPSCYSACWDCRFGFCDRRWHTKADPDDVYMWKRDGEQGPDPRTLQCICWCQFYTPKPLIHNGRKPR